MAKPDLNDGYLMVAHELMAAVMTAHVPQEARVVLFEVFSQLYGPAKLKEAILAPPEIARRTGLKPANVWRGIGFLVTNGMLVRDPASGTYRWVKDYARWGVEGKPLLSPQMASYAVHAPMLAMSHKVPKNPQTPKRKAPADRIGFDTNSTNADVSKDGRSYRKRYDGRIENDTIPPYREKEKYNYNNDGGDEEIASVSDSGEEAEGIEPFEATPADPLPAPVDARPAPVPGELRRPFRPDPAELERVRAWVLSELGPDNPAVMNVGRFSPQYPLAWIEQAIEEALSTPGMRPNDAWRYAYRCLSDWWKLGGPPKAQTRITARIAAPLGLPSPVRLTAQQERKRLQRAAYSDNGTDESEEHR